MNNRSAQSLVAAERVRQMAVDDAKRALSDAIYVCNAARKKVEALQAQAASAEAHALALLQAPGILDVSSLHAAQRYRRWHRVELDSARQSLAREERAEAEARSALGACVRARDAVRRLQVRRRLEERERAARSEQHALDDLAACRLCDASTTARGSRQKSRLLPAATELMSDKRAGARLDDRRSARRVPSTDGQAQKAPQATFSNEVDAIRAMASKRTSSFPSGDQNGR